MRNYLHIDLNEQTVKAVEQRGEELVRVGRYLIARTLVEENIAGVDPLAPENPLIFSAGPFAGTNFSNANRTSIGCKSPLTGGVKEANAGGTLGVALGQLHLSGFTLHGAADDWVIIHLRKDGSCGFDPAAGFMGKGNFETAALLHDKYGKKVSLALCGPVGEYQGLLAGIAISDSDRRPSRLAARGGVGAVLGSKKVKGDRRGPEQDAATARTQKSHRRGALLCRKTRRRPDDRQLQTLRHGNDGGLYESRGRPAGTQFLRRTPGRHRPRNHEDGRRFPAPAEYCPGRRNRNTRACPVA